MLDVTSVGQGSSGPNVECVQKALTAAGFYTGPVDGVFSPALTASATTFQQATGLYVDGVVGRRTAAMLGIWPGDDSFVIRTPPPAPGAEDSMGFRLSSVATTGDDAPPLPPDAGQGTGRRIVYQRAGQRVWAIDDNEHIVRSYLVTGSQFNNEMPGKHKVYSKSEMTTGWNGQADLPLMVRWLDTERGAIGFHQIPTHKSDGSVYQTEAELGQRLSGGCQRQAPLDAQFMWYFAEIGTPVGCSRAKPDSVRYIGRSSLITAQTAPPGSWITAIRPTGMSIGSTWTVPPSDLARSAMASQSATAKYTIQCVGKPGGKFSFICMHPPIGLPSRCSSRYGNGSSCLTTVHPNRSE